MTQLTVRKLLIDLQTPFAVRWCAGDAFKTAFFNALSMSFPLGEQYFMDSVRAGLRTLPEAEQARFAAEVQGFVGQEATHRRIHSLFNAQLAQQGFDNAMERRIARRVQAHAHLDVRMHVGATAATEHLTALFADWMLAHPEAMDGTEERLRTLWLWHSAEESEHRSTAFDMYLATGGNHAWRVRLFRYVTWTFFTDVARQTVRNLWHDKALFRWSTWRSAGPFLFGPQGILRSNVSLWRDYLREDFHPSQHPAQRSAQWLRDNSDQFTPVGPVNASAA
jgi:predicted metal-dependent hydrolase